MKYLLNCYKINRVVKGVLLSFSEINSVLREVERGMDEESERRRISAERNKPLRRTRILESSDDSGDN